MHRHLSRRVFLGGSALLALGAVAGLTAPQPDRVPGQVSVPTADSPQPAKIASPSRYPARATVAPAPATETIAVTPSPGPSPMVAGGLQAATNAPAEPKQPNVLLVTIDTLRADRIGAYGFGPAHTPVLDRLAREGVRCEHAICQLPQTDPSHAALMTGLYASTSGVRTHMLDKLRPGTPTLAGIFQAAGYQTAGIYSWVSLDAQFCGLDRGFQTYQGYVLNRGAVFGNPALEQAAAAYRQVKAALPVVQTVDQALGTSADYEATMDGRADVTNQAVFAWLDAHAAAGPFFLWVHYYDPHYPYSPPPGYDHVLGLDYRGTIDGSVDTIHQIENGQLHPTPADLARLGELYQGEIAFVDAQLGALLDHLGRVGVAEDTIVVVAGDHGESFGEHGDWAHGLRVFETEIRVPLLLHYPRRLPAGVVVTAPVQLIDVLPTLLDLSGLKAKQLVQGTSLLPLLDGTDPGDSRAAFTELADRSYLSVLTWGDWKLVRDTAKDRLQLYHLTGDESERSDLAATQPQTTREMLARLQDMIDLAGAR